MSTGLALSKAFFHDVVAPIIGWAMPDLDYAAARLGDGSEVLGFDTDMSADHNYGPTVQIFLGERDFETRGQRLMEQLDQLLPDDLGGWPIRYESQGRPGREMAGMLGSDHGVELFTIEAWAQRQLGTGAQGPRTPLAWLSLPEQKLLTATSGAVFRDDSGELVAFRERLAYFPRDIWLRKLAAQWQRIGEEQAFVGRTGDIGDELGSRLIAARLVQDVMRLCFLVERQYVPYAKWFGSAFAKLPSLPVMKPVLERVLAAPTSDERQRALVDAYLRVGVLQKTRLVPGAIQPEIGPYFTRPFKVVNAEAIAAALLEAIEDPEVFALTVPGGIDQMVDATPILADIERSRRVMAAITAVDG